MAWGLENGTFDVFKLATRAAREGLDWVAVQDTPFNRSVARELNMALTAVGVDLVVWSWATSPAVAVSSISTFSAKGFVANVEHPGDWGPYCDLLRDRVGPSFPLAVITNFAGTLARPSGVYDPQLAEPWVRNRFAWITESYMVNEQGPQPSLAPEIMDWTARTHGNVPETFPCFGIYRVGPAFYAEKVKAWPHHSWYLLEYHPAFRG